MTDDLYKRELEIERELGRWAGRLDILPEAEVVHSVRTAVWRELDDGYWAVHPSPVPAPEVIEQVRTAVAAELTRQGTRGRLLRWVPAQAWGSLGAAAMLVLCFGVIWYASRLPRPADSLSEVDLLLAVVSESPLDPIQMEVQSLEARLPEDGTFPESEGESLADLVEELDELLEARDPSRTTSNADGRPAGVLG